VGAGKMKETMIRYGLILSIICAVATASLAIINSLTKGRIIAQVKAEEEASFKEVMPEGASFEPVKSGDEVAYYKVYDKDKKFIGAIFKASGKGYSSVIETVAGMKKNGEITDIKVVNQNETPGLGTRVTEKSFTAQFGGKNAESIQGVDAITGATISSKAVITSVNQKAAEIKELIKNER
jgi:electron transport complex protein RnfG